jgi:hypothetical protein
MIQREQVLTMLQDAGPKGCTTSDFLRARIPRFSARVEELRNAGCSITSERLRGSSWRYVLREGESVSTRATGPNSPSLSPKPLGLFESTTRGTTTISAITGDPL